MCFTRKMCSNRIYSLTNESIYYLFYYSSLCILNILYSTDNRQIYIYDSDDNYYVDSDDYGDVGYYYDDDSDDETIFDWFY